MRYAGEKNQKNGKMTHVRGYSLPLIPAAKPCRVQNVLRLGGRGKQRPYRPSVLTDAKAVVLGTLIPAAKPTADSVDSIAASITACTRAPSAKSGAAGVSFRIASTNRRSPTGRQVKTEKGLLRSASPRSDPGSARFESSPRLPARRESPCLSGKRPLRAYRVRRAA